MYRVWSIKSLDPSLNMCHSLWWDSVLNILQGWYHMSVSTWFPIPNTQCLVYLPTFTYQKWPSMEANMPVPLSMTWVSTILQLLGGSASWPRKWLSFSREWEIQVPTAGQFRWMASGWISAKPGSISEDQNQLPPPNSNKKLPQNSLRIGKKQHFTVLCCFFFFFEVKHVFF